MAKQMARDDATNSDTIMVANVDAESWSLEDVDAQMNRSEEDTDGGYSDTTMSDVWHGGNCHSTESKAQAILRAFSAHFIEHLSSPSYQGAYEADGSSPSTGAFSLMKDDSSANFDLSHESNIDQTRIATSTPSAVQYFRNYTCGNGIIIGTDSGHPALTCPKNQSVNWQHIQAPVVHFPTPASHPDYFQKQVRLRLPDSFDLERCV